MDSGEQHHHAQAHHGRGGFDLAGPGGGDDPALLHGDEPQAGHGKFPEKHNGHHPAGHLPVLDEEAHGRQHQHFIRQRVHKFAEIGDLVVMPGNVAVSKVRQAGDNVNCQCPDHVARVGQSQEYGDQNDTGYGYLICCRFQHIHLTPVLR